VQPSNSVEAARDRAALAAALDPIITIDAAGIIQSASDSVERVLGWAPAELLGRNVSVLMPEPHRSAHDGYLGTYHRTGKTNIMNRPRRFQAMRKDGSLIAIELCVSRANVSAGGAPLFVGIIRDMSDFVAAEVSHEQEQVRSQQLLAEQTSALQTAHVRLRMADRMASIGTLAAGLGHDMNNVLLPVRARLNALRAAGQAGRVPAAEIKHVEEIRKSVGYLQQLADGLHFLALDPEAEDKASDGGATDLQQWWSQARALLSKAVPKHVRVSASLSAKLPKAAIAPHGLTQAVLNLIVNAGEAIPGPEKRKRRQGHVRLWADVLRDDRGEWVRLGVSDNGTGMTDEVKRRAFEMFYTTKPRGLGTGLGLVLVRNVVERTGGRVEVESETGKGTTVTLIIPSVQAREAGKAGTLENLVAIRVPDGRAASLIRHILEVSGAKVNEGDKLGDARALVIDPAAADIREVRRWRKEHLDGHLVLLGRPRSAGLWRPLKPVTIEDPSDLEEVRSALARAIAPN